MESPSRMVESGPITLTKSTLQCQRVAGTTDPTENQLYTAASCSFETILAHSFGQPLCMVESQ